MQSKLIQNVRTVEEANILSEELNMLSSSLYETKEGNYEDVLNNRVRSWVRQIVLQEAGSERQEYLDGLMKDLGSLLKIQVTIACEPSDGFLQNLSDWLRKNVEEGIIIDLKVKKSIIAGAEISYKGKFYDGTLAKKFEEDVLNHKSQ